MSQDPRRVIRSTMRFDRTDQRSSSRSARSAKINRITLTDAWATRHLVVCVRHMHELPTPARQMVQHVMAADLT